MATYYDISNIASWQAACEDWNTTPTANVYRLTADTTLLVSALNLLNDNSNNFTNFSETFDGCGNTLTLDGGAGTDLNKSLFMDLSGGTIKNFTFDITNCGSDNAIGDGFITGKTVTTFKDYGNFYDINIINNNSTTKPGGAGGGGYMIGQYFGYQCDSLHTIDICGCSFNGDDITSLAGGGLCGSYFCNEAEGTIIIKNCDINANISVDNGSGFCPIQAFYDIHNDCSINITNVNFNGDISGIRAVGLFGISSFDN